MKKKHLIYLLGISMLLYTCSSSSSDDLSDPNPNPTPSAVTYEDDIKSIINGNCIACHGDPRQNGAPTTYTTYTQVKNAVDNIINRVKGVGSIMPPSPRSPLTAAQIALIEQWKTDGLLED